MSRLVKCDNCGKVTPADRNRFLGDDYSYVDLSIEANEDCDNAQFCSWLCLGTWAMEKAMGEVKA
jgi:hypothetical protein